MTYAVRPALEPDDHRRAACRGLDPAIFHPDNGRTGRTHCGNGHAYTAETTRITKAGHRRCLVCERATKRKPVLV